MVSRVLRPILGLSIRLKILLIVMVTSGMALLFTFGIYTGANFFQLRDVKVQVIEEMAEGIEDTVEASLSFLDKERALQNIQPYTKRGTLEAICVYNAEMEVFVSYHAERSLSRSCPLRLETGHRFSEGYLHLSRTIIDRAGEKIGYVYVRSALADIYDSIVGYALLALLAIPVAFVLAYLIAAKLLGVIADPISSLVSTAREVSENYNYEVRVEKTTSDELGVLVDAFNDMLYQIHERDVEVIAAKEGLEQRVTDRTKQLARAKEIAEAANRAKSEFLANMSHELRTPMHAILSFADFGIDEIHDASKEELLLYYKRINESGQRLLSLLNNLLDLSKLEAGKMEFHLTDEDLRMPLEGVLRELQPLIDEKHLKVEVIEPGFKPNAFCDTGKIMQVIRNLFSNAIKFSPEGGQITVSFDTVTLPSSDGKSVNAVSCSVQDQGVGVPEDELEKVFDKFIQSTKTMTGAGGTGLGLAICSEIVQEHGGKIWCENNIDGGAKFVFVLPAEQSVSLAANAGG